MKVFQIIYGEIAEVIKPCIESVRAVYPGVQILIFPEVENPVSSSDNYRIDVLSKEDDVLYLDWDIMLERELELIKNGNLGCSFYKGAPDLSIIYSPSKEIWVDFEAERVRRHISKDTYGWPRKILRNMKVNEITGGYRHLNFSGGQKKWLKRKR